MARGVCLLHSVRRVGLFWLWISRPDFLILTRTMNASKQSVKEPCTTNSLTTLRSLIYPSNNVSCPSTERRKAAVESFGGLFTRPVLRQASANMAAICSA